MGKRPAYKDLLTRIAELEKQVLRQQRSETALRESEDRYRSLVENSLSAIILYRQEKILFANKPFFAIFGYDSEELNNIVVDDLLAPETVADVAERRRRRLAGEIEAASVYESKGKRKNGEVFEMEISVCLVSYQGEPCCMASLSDISARKKSEIAIRESEARFRTLFELSPQAVALAELETGKIIDANDHFSLLTRYSKEEVINRTTTEIRLYSKEKRNRFLKKLKESGEVHGMEMDFRIKDGSLINTLMFSKILQISGRPMILTILFDITERKRLETQLQHAQKMEAIGTLAGGIAHEFNNLLMAIQGNASLILSDMDKFHPHYEKIRNIETIVKSGARLTSQLLGYARKGKYEIRPIDLNRIVEETIETFGSARKDIIIHSKLVKDIPAIEADQGQIVQILLNLLINAADAMPAGGQIKIETENIPYAQVRNKPYRVKPGNYVLLKIADTGSGMDKETMDRIFEPFFTTKTMGRGTGLGLASVYGSVKAHGGYIDVESEKNKGSTFSIYLPATGERVKTERHMTYRHVGGTETILLIDDEKMVRETGAMMLEKLGYSALSASSGKAAIGIYEEKKDNIDMIILDMIMPDLGGEQTYDRLRKINPHVKVLLSSGYSMNDQAEKILKRGCNGFIQKPFTMEELSAKLREILEKTD